MHHEKIASSRPEVWWVTRKFDEWPLNRSVQKLQTLNLIQNLWQVYIFSVLKFDAISFRWWQTDDESYSCSYVSPRRVLCCGCFMRVHYPWRTPRHLSDEKYENIKYVVWYKQKSGTYNISVCLDIEFTPLFLQIRCKRCFTRTGIHCCTMYTTGEIDFLFPSNLHCWRQVMTQRWRVVFYKCLHLLEHVLCSCDCNVCSF